MPTKPVQTRLEPEFVRELDRRAKRARKSRSEILRDIAIAAVTDEKTDEILHRLEAVEREVIALRRKLAKATAALLIDTNQLRRDLGKDSVPADRINAWVSDNIMR